MVLLSPATRLSVAADASVAERFAADELQALLRRACPGNASEPSYEIGRPRARQPHQIAIGPGAAMALGVPHSALHGLRDERYYAARLTSTPNTIALAGGVGSARGTLYAVHRTLESAGFRFLASDETIVPDCAQLRITLPAEGAIYGGPAFSYRDNNQWAITERVDATRSSSTEVNGSASLWAMRVGYNGRHAIQPARRGGYIRFAEPPGFAHTSYRLLTYPEQPEREKSPPHELYNKHPEWFWPRGPAGRNSYGQLCWSNSSLVEYLILQATAILRAQPEASLISISQNDNNRQCADDLERHVNAREGSDSSAMLLAVNAIADALAVDFPHVAVHMFAYEWSRRPPTSGLRPRPNVVIQVCMTMVDYVQPLSGASNAAFDSHLMGWYNITNGEQGLRRGEQRRHVAERVGQLHVWDYICSFTRLHGYVQPFPNWRVIVPNIRYLHARGTVAYFAEGAYDTPGGDLPELQAYLVARALWDPTIDAEREMNEFIEGYYGRCAAPAVKTWMQSMAAGVDAAGSAYRFTSASLRCDEPYLLPRLLLASAVAYRDAIAACDAEGPSSLRFARRARFASMPLMYVVLNRWDELRKWQGANKAKVPKWPYSSSLREQYVEFKRLYELRGMNRLDEHGTTILWLERWLFRDQWWLIGGQRPERQGVVMGIHGERSGELARQAGARKREAQGQGAFIVPPWERESAREHLARAFGRVFG